MEEFMHSIGILIIIIIGIISEIVKSLLGIEKKYKPSQNNANEQNEIHEYSRNAESNMQLKSDLKQEVHKSRKNFINVMGTVVDSVSYKMETLEETYKPKRANHVEFSDGDMAKLGEFNYDSNGPIKTHPNTSIDFIGDKKHYSSETYHIVPEIKDADHDVYNHVNMDTNINKAELKKAIIMKEVLDKPVAYKKIRR